MSKLHERIVRLYNTGTEGLVEPGAPPFDPLHARAVAALEKFCPEDNWGFVEDLPEEQWPEHYKGTDCWLWPSDLRDYELLDSYDDPEDVYNSHRLYRRFDNPNDVLMLYVECLAMEPCWCSFKLYRKV